MAVLRDAFTRTGRVVLTIEMILDSAQNVSVEVAAVAGQMVDGSAVRSGPCGRLRTARPLSPAEIFYAGWVKCLTASS